MVEEFVSSLLFIFYFFFFQAEDGIRDIGVTGVQTCALPISVRGLRGIGPRTGAAMIRTMTIRTILMLWLAWQTMSPEAVQHWDAGRRAESEIGRGAGRGKEEISGGAVSLKKKKIKNGRTI